MGRGNPRGRFFKISFSKRNLAFSCRNRATSTSNSVTGLTGGRFSSAWPLRARYTQFSSVFADISSERATEGILRPPSITCLTAASRNAIVYFRSDPTFIINTSTRSNYHTSWRPFFGDQIKARNAEGADGKAEAH
jgi:hypothetical protein